MWTLYTNRYKDNCVYRASTRSVRETVYRIPTTKDCVVCIQWLIDKSRYD